MHRVRIIRSLLASLAFIILSCAALPQAVAETPEQLSWSTLPELPTPLGLGGPYAGVSNGTLIVAGGANFPDGPPWEDPPGEKVWHDEIYIYSPAESKWLTGSQLETPSRLPRSLAYGVSISMDDALLLIGGEEDGEPVADVLRLRWNSAPRAMAIDSLPPLPRPSSYLAGGRIGSTIYIAASHRSEGARQLDTKSFWALDLAPGEKKLQWKELPAWPGPPRHKAIAAVQAAGEDQQFFYLFGGENPAFNAEGEADTAAFEYFQDAYRFDPKEQTWREISGTAKAPIEPANARAVAAAAAIDLGQSHILVFSGATGEGIELPPQDRPPFPKHVLAYHTITDRWTLVGEMPQEVVTTTAVRWNDRIVIPSGEVRPGIRTSLVQTATVENRPLEFGTVNYAVLIGYLVALVAMGFYFSKREKGTADYFLAGKRIPWWAAGLSIYATQLSAITFVSIPAVAYASNWLVYPGQITIFLMAPVVVIFYLPFFRRLNVTTAYEYLERRFNLAVRLFGSLSFVVFQLGRMSVVVYLPALALSAVTGIDTYTCIATMGVLATVYTVLGGMEAVIWTDVLQVFVLWGGICLSLVIILINVDGLGTVYHTASEHGKLWMFNWTWDTSQAATWLILIGSFALQFGPYTTDQAVVQRYMTTKDDRAAARSIWLNGALAIPFSLLFFVLGTCLFVFFEAHPNLLMLGMENDKVFPLFMATQLPIGLSGLVIAGVFAASMSSLDSSMHSVATALTTDFYRRLNPQADDHGCLRLARVLTVAVGGIGTLVALLLARYDISSLFFLFQKLLGLISSGLVGIFILGIFTRRSHSIGVLIGAVASFCVLFYVTTYTDVHFYLYAVIGIGTSVTVGYVASWLLPSTDGESDGLTWWSLSRLPRQDA